MSTLTYSDDWEGGTDYSGYDDDDKPGLLETLKQKIADSDLDISVSALILLFLVILMLMTICCIISFFNRCSKFCETRQLKRKRRQRRQQRRLRRLQRQSSLSDTQQPSDDHEDDEYDEEEGGRNENNSNNNGSTTAALTLPTAPPQEQDDLQKAYLHLLKQLTKNIHANCSMIVKDGDLVHDTYVTCKGFNDHYTGKKSISPFMMYDSDSSSSSNNYEDDDNDSDFDDDKSCDISVTSFRTNVGYLIVPEVIQELHFGKMTSVPNCCAICIEAYRIGDSVTFSTNPQCCHAYHTKCVASFLTRLNHNSSIQSNTDPPAPSALSESTLTLTKTDCPTCRRQFLL